MSSERAWTETNEADFIVHLGTHSEDKFSNDLSKNELLLRYRDAVLRRQVFDNVSQAKILSMIDIERGRLLGLKI